MYGLKLMEQMIIFVYDTGFCRTEADDPQKAVLFFHPHWVSDQQRLALCGQLMGAAHFCSSVFSSPRVLTLQCGKFILKKFGRYILSVGSDQTLPEWILQERFNTLELLIQFYHNSFDSIFNEVDCDQEAFSKKLTEILEVYIPILQFIICSLGNVFIVRCPKKNSAAFLEAFQLLEACCNFKGVLGGVVLHNSRVIATQLDPEMSKLLALTDKSLIRSRAEHIKIPHHLPVGVQLIKVYIKQKVYEALQSAVSFKTSTYNGVQKKYLQKVGKVVKRKKDLNKIFTVHEEEDWNPESSFNLNDTISNSKEATRLKTRKSKSKIENSFLKERSKSFVADHNIKVCSTPTVEKTLIHDELVSICSSGKAEQKPSNSAVFVPDIVQDAIKSKYHSRMNPETKYFYNRLYRISMDDLMIDLTHKAYPVPLRYYSFGLPKMNRETDSSGKEEKNKKRLYKKNFYKTIADPMNPVFRHDGVPVSKSLHNSSLDEHYKDFMMANIAIDSREEFLKSKHVETGKFQGKTDLCLKSIESNLSKTLSQTDTKVSDKENSVGAVVKNLELNKDKKELTSANQKAFRRSLSLPLKPLFCETAENISQNSAAKNKVVLHARTPTTPLTTKLSLLAFEEQLEVKPPPTPSDNNQLKNLMKNVSAKKDVSDENKNSETVATNLFVCSYQSMTILLFLDEDVVKNPDVILSLWEMSSTSLKKVENLRNKSMAHLANSGNSASSYSFLSLDTLWGTVQRSGSWNDGDLKIVGSLNHDFVEVPNITEVIVRNEDSVVYGYSCGGTKIFYQQAGCSSAGLPTPADLMGVVTLKARRRLERDRDIILL